jgi:aconitate hydratase
MYLGVRVVLAKSLERIHAANLINFGILPLTFISESDYDIIDQGDDLEIDAIRKAIAEGTNPVINNKTKGRMIEVRVTLSSRQKQIVLSGGVLNIRSSNKFSGSNFS